VTLPTTAPKLATACRRVASRSLRREPGRTEALADMAARGAAGDDRGRQAQARGASRGGRAARGRDGRPLGSGRDERGRVRTDLQGVAGESAADVRRGAREGGRDLPAADLPTARRRADPGPSGGPSGESRRARGRVPARGGGLRGPAPEAASGPRAIRWRCRAGGCTRRSRSHCDCTPTARRRWRSTTTW
jgi:hypothetical protein